MTRDLRPERREVVGVQTFTVSNYRSRKWYQPRHRGVISFNGYEVHGPYKWTQTAAQDWVDYYAVTQRSRFDYSQ